MSIGFNSKIPRGHFRGQAHISETAEEDSESLEAILSNVQTNLYRGAGVTVADIELWVSKDGNDEVGDGSEDNPYETFTRAMQDVPFRIDHTVHIRIGAGEYNETLSGIVNVFGTNGYLCIEGTDTPTRYDGPFSPMSFGTVPSGSEAYTEIVFLDPFIQPDFHWGKWIKVSDGGAAGYFWPVYKNTWNGINFHYINTSVGSINLIEMIHGPTVTLEFEHGLCISSVNRSFVCGGGTWDASRIAIGGITLKSNSTNRFPFVIDNSLVWLAFVNFEIPDKATAPLSSMVIDRSFVNYFSPAKLGVFDNSLFESWDFGGFMFKRGDTPWTGSYSTGIDIRDSEVYRLSSRDVVVCRKRMQLTQCICAGLSMSFADCSIWYTGIDPVGMSMSLAPINLLYSRSAISNVYIESSGGNSYAIDIRGSDLELSKVTGNTSLIPGYALRTRVGSNVSRKSSTTIAGTTGDTIFHQTGVANPWPASGSAVTDGQGAYIVGSV